MIKTEDFFKKSTFFQPSPTSDHIFFRNIFQKKFLSQEKQKKGSKEPFLSFT